MFVGARLLEGKTADHYSSILRPDSYNWWCRKTSWDWHYLLCTHTSLIKCISRTILIR